MSLQLNPSKALIFRIVHRANLPWILRHDRVSSRTSPEQDPEYINIGSAALIAKRSGHAVPIPPGGTLSDYVPFYFTPFSIMMYNILTGHGGVVRRAREEIIILVASLRRVQELGLPFVFTDQHAYAAGTEFFGDLARLDRIDWALLQSRNFKTDSEDPGRQLRYQAEALVHRHVPLTALSGIGCQSERVRQQLESLIAASGRRLTVKATPSWYFE